MTLQIDQVDAARKWATGQAWTGYQELGGEGVNFDIASPTCDGETLGETLRRVGNDFFLESQEPGSKGPNAATLQETKDLRALYPGVNTLFEGAMNAGFTIRMAHEDPITEMIAQLDPSPHLAHHPVGDINPRYASLVGDSVSGVGSPQVGRVTTTDYDDDV